MQISSFSGLVPEPQIKMQTEQRETPHINTLRDQSHDCLRTTRCLHSQFCEASTTQAFHPVSKSFQYAPETTLWQQIIDYSANFVLFTWSYESWCYFFARSYFGIIKTAVSLRHIGQRDHKEKVVCSNETVGKTRIQRQQQLSAKKWTRTKNTKLQINFW